MRYPLTQSRYIPAALLLRLGRRPGFALIIVLTLMAFLVLLFVTLTVSIQVAAQVSENNIQTTQARLNALYGVNVAIAQLQKFAGRDQAVTGTADLGSGNVSNGGYPGGNFLARNDTTNTGVYVPSGNGTTYWTGVWGNPNPPSSIYTGNQIAASGSIGSNTTGPTPVLLNWLVSGNENTTLYVTINSTTNQIQIGNSSAALMPYTPNATVTLSNNTPFTANVTANSQLSLKTPTVSNVTSVLLMGPNSAGNSSVNLVVNGTTLIQPATARYVVAPLVPLYTPDVSGTSTVSAVTGNYAYWVSDEGVKAKYNMVDAYNGTTFSNSTAVATTNYTKVSGNLTPVNTFLYRLVVPQRYAIEEMGNLTTYPANNSTLKNIIEPLQAHYVATSDSDPIAADTLLNNDPLRLHTHDFTTYSYGVLSDSLHGGLKYDLTTAFEMSAIFSGTGTGGNQTYSLAGRNILPDGVSSGANSTVAKTDPNYDAGTTVISPLAGLKWDKLYNYYNLGSAITNPALTSTSVPIQPGVVPIVVGGRLQFGLFLTNPPSGSGAETAFATWAAFVIANPYNYTISGNIDLHYTINTHTKSEWGIAAAVRHTASNTTQIFYRSNDTRALSYRTSTTNGVSGPEFTAYFPVLKNSLDFAANVSGPSILDPVYFHISNLSLLPGQATIYALSSTSVGLPAAFPPVQLGINSAGTNTTYICMNTNSGLANVSLLMAPVGSGGSLSSFFLTHTNAGNGTITNAALQPANDSRLWLVGTQPSVACTLQIFANTTSTGPGTSGTLVQSIMGMDLTGGNIAGTPPLTPEFTNGFYQIYADIGQSGPPPHFIVGYYFWLGMPDTFTVNINAATNNFSAYNTSSIAVRALPTMDLSTNSSVIIAGAPTGNSYTGQNYRTYADFNLRASNVTIPPNSGLLTLNQVNSLGVITSATNAIFPNVPPYIRLWDQGAGAITDGFIYASDTLFSHTGSMGILSSGAIYNGTWGHENGNETSGGNQLGQTNVVLYALPWRSSLVASNDLPLLSLGQFQHADLTADDIYSSVSYQPGNAFGNSMYTPFVHRAQSIQPITNNQTTVLSGLTATASGGNYTLGPGASNTTVNAYDISYLVNAAIWDHYYFSGVAQGINSSTKVAVPPGSTPNTVAGQMSNPRMKFAAGFSPNNTLLNIGTSTLSAKGAEDIETSTTAAINYIPQPYVLSRYLVNDGAFNVNSTSVEAWKAVLASLRGVNPGLTTGNGTSNLTSAIGSLSAENAPGGTAAVVAFPRVLPGLPMINTPSISSNYTNQKTNLGDNNASFVGYRSLSDTDISNLASMIVQQVRARGPFLSLAQFVNRSLTSATDPRSKDGAIQAAIDGLQGGAFNTMTDLSTNTTLANDAVTFMTPYPNFDTNGNDTLYRSTGIPGWLTQADILQAIAPVLTTRSDTFVIRAYGQVDNPLDGSVQSRAWCEAIVQREPEYIDTVTQAQGTNLPDNPAMMPWLANPANNFFGRRMRLISLHWLNPSDI